jgi:rod shape-determining protein MreC
MLILNRYSWWVASMVGLALLLAVMTEVGLLTPFQSIFLRASAPVERVFTGIFKPVASVLSDAGQLSDLQDENARLRLDNEALRNRITDLEQNEQRLKELEEALGITTGAAPGTREIANVVHRDNSAFTNVVTIDIGNSKGIVPGMVVLSSQGTLIGTVTRVVGEHSFVRLITDSRSKVSATVEATGAEGIVRGTPNRTLTLELAQGEIKVGDTLVTAGLGGNYPRGIPIGEVKEISGTAQDLFKRVVVEPRVRISTVDTVLVDTSFVPQSLLGAQ